jgi:hypothetical protein
MVAVWKKKSQKRHTACLRTALRTLISKEKKANERPILMATLMTVNSSATVPPKHAWLHDTMRDTVSTLGAILELTFCSYQHYEKAYMNYFQFGRY